MSKRPPTGLYLPSGQFVRFAAPDEPYGTQIATRQRAFGQFGQYLGWLPNPDPVLRKLGQSIQTYRELRSDATVGGAIRRRKSAVLSMERGLGKARSQTKRLQAVGAIATPRGRPQAADRVAADVDAILDDLPLGRIIAEILDAPLYGYQPLEIVWGQAGSYIVPVDLVGKPPEWFAYSPDNELLFKSLANPMGESLPPNSIICARQDPTYENPYGFPDLSMCFWPTFFKKAGFGQWAKFCQKYGMPWPVGKYPRGTDPAGQEVEALLDALEQMVEDGVAAIPADSSVELLKNDQSQGADNYERFIKVCRSEVSIALLGQNQTTEADATRASAAAGQEVTREIRDGDAAIVAGAMNELVRIIRDLNFSGTRLPPYELWQQEEVDDLLAKRDKLLVEAGATPTRIYWMRQYGFQEDELAPDQPPATPAPGGNLVGFAAHDTGGQFADQAALDNAVGKLTDSPALVDQADALTAPIVRLVEDADGYRAVLDGLPDQFLKLNTHDLEQTLANALFVAHLWGYANGLDEDIPLPTFAGEGPVDLLYAMGLSPKEAVDYFQRKGLAVSRNWYDLLGDIHSTVFTVAHVARLDVLQDIRDAVQEALEKGVTFGDFQKNLRPKLMAKGWWGQAIDPATGEILETYPGTSVPVQWGSPRRLKTIYEVNLQTSFMAGRRARQLENVADRPYWMYIAVMDSRTRPEHRVLHGRVFRYDDPFWRSFYPPVGWRCRCRVRALSADQVGDGEGQIRLSVSEGKLKSIEIPVSVRNPDAGTAKVEAFEYMPGRWMHPDAGWSHPPGRGWTPNLDRYNDALVAEYRKAREARPQ